MKPNRGHSFSKAKATRGFTLMEFLIATALAGLVMAMIVGAFNFAGTNFVAMGNYSDLDRKSRQALDLFSREIRNSSAVIAATTNGTPTLQLTNATQQAIVTLTYSPTARTLTMTKTGQSGRVLLTQCDQWDFSLYGKAPNLTSTNILFFPAANIASCKLINMTWKCSRTILGTKRNTETIQTAQLVLRNKVN